MKDIHTRGAHTGKEPHMKDIHAADNRRKGASSMKSSMKRPFSTKGTSQRSTERAFQTYTERASQTSMEGASL